MSDPGCNIVVTGVSLFDGMASSTRVRNLFEPLIKMNLVTASNLVFETDNKEPIGRQGKLNDIEFEVIGFRLANFFSIFSFWYRGISFLKRNRKRDCKNILYNYNYPDLKNIVFILYAKLKGYRIIIDVIEDNRYESHISFINKARLKTSIFLFRFSRYFVHTYVAISEHLRQRCQEISKDRVPVHLIPVTVNLNYFKNEGYEPDKSNLKIFYGGSFGEKDGLGYLVDAFDEVCKTDSRVKLILTGAGNNRDVEKIKQRIENSPNRDRVIFMGFLSISDYYATLNSCDIFCMTRINSRFANAGFPFKLGEFLATGKGVIATNVGDVSSYLEDGVNALLISPNTVNELANAILTFINEPGKIKLLGAGARKTAETNFDSEKVGLRLLSSFRSA